MSQPSFVIRRRLITREDAVLSPKFVVECAGVEEVLHGIGGEGNPTIELNGKHLSLFKVLHHLRDWIRFIRELYREFLEPKEAKHAFEGIKVGPFVYVKAEGMGSG